MADNRLYIRCKVCRETTLVSKCLGGPYGLFKRDMDRINQFFEDHCYCDLNHNAEEYTWGGKFELVDEFDLYEEEKR